jgi:chromosomal replication initiator protein
VDSKKHPMTDLQATWQQTITYLKEALGSNVVETWLMPLKPRLGDSHSLLLEAPDRFFCDWVNNHYLDAITAALERAGIQEAAIKIEASTGPAQEMPAPKNNSNIALRAEAGPYPKNNLNARYTFENFVVGPSNRHAHASSMAVAQSPAKIYNPLFIYGGIGLGKTHLIQAICQQTQSKEPGLKICYIASERFTNELIEAIQHKTTPQFRQKYRGVDLLVIDDVHFIAGKESTQEEFFHTFNALYDAHKQIVISSDRPPKEIANLQDRLVSRFSWGLATDIQPPDIETRVAILKKKLERESVQIPGEVIFFIAQLIKANIRELEGALVRTIAYALMEEKPVTLELTKEALRDLVREPKRLITVDFIQRCVGEEFGISLYDLKTKRRNKNIVVPRQVAMYISRELTDLSLPEIGMSFGGKDHTTVLHSCNKIKEQVKQNQILRHKIERLMNFIQQ